MTKLEAVITIRVFLNKMEMLGRNMDDFVEKLESPNAMAITAKELVECEAIENINELAKGMKEALQHLKACASRMMDASAHCGQSERIWRDAGLIQSLREKAEGLFVKP